MTEFGFLNAFPFSEQLTAVLSGTNNLSRRDSTVAAMVAMAYEDIASGAGDEVTIRWNREDYNQLKLRPRVLVDVDVLDTSLERGRSEPGRGDSPRRVQDGHGPDRTPHARGDRPVGRDDGHGPPMALDFPSDCSLSRASVHTKA